MAAVAAAGLAGGGGGGAAAAAGGAQSLVALRGRLNQPYLSARSNWRWVCK